MSKPCMCTFCDKTFSTNSNLKRHLKEIHHHEEDAVSQESRFTCVICNKKLKTNKEYETHQIQNHEIKIEKENITFSNSDLFYS